MDRQGISRKLSRRTNTAETRVSRAVVKYAFVGLSARAGATTLSFAFADWLARSVARGKTKSDAGPGSAGRAGRDARGVNDDFDCGAESGGAYRAPGSVAVVEISDDYPQLGGSDYDRIGVDVRFAGREYVSAYACLARGASVRGVSNIDGGINWLLRSPGEPCGELGVTDYIRLASGATGDTVIVDVKGGFGGAGRIPMLQKLISDCDRVFAVVDPLPSALMADAEKLELFKSLESGGTDILYVINKMNPGVDVREMRSFIRVRNVVELPFLPAEGIYASEYNCCTVYSMPKIAPLLEAAFTRMAL
ncbi:MAG: hypothetical protein LBJ91_00455 [Clostridiales Family XIII bacterium]|jgi:hypothetical protein|nr:hypothetical protein [Clostridiales Family XIII bacterium]